MHTSSESDSSLIVMASPLQSQLREMIVIAVMSFIISMLIMRMWETHVPSPYEKKQRKFEDRRSSSFSTPSKNFSTPSKGFLTPSMSISTTSMNSSKISIKVFNTPNPLSKKFHYADSPMIASCFPGRLDAFTNFDENGNLLVKLEGLFNNRYDWFCESKSNRNLEEILKIIDSKRETLKSKQETNFFHHKVKKLMLYVEIAFTIKMTADNSMTYKQIRSIIENGTTYKGKTIHQHNEILGLELAMKHATTLFPAIEVKDILEIHRRVLGHVNPITSGTFRNKHVSKLSYMHPSPEDLPHLMESYVEWFNSKEAQALHPVEYATVAHLKLYYIHPFEDGNGRMSRLIMNFILMQAGYPSIIIPQRYKKMYYEYLELAAREDENTLVLFIAHCAEWTIDSYLVLSNVPNQHGVWDERSLDVEMTC